jgi:hypothetical protein|tara:strand:+ start:1784 stop:2272 length:489 start_codon:yes stop_codon:yes gene_type:complete
LSSQTNTQYIYQVKNNKLFLWKIRSIGDSVPTTSGEITSSGTNRVIYPPENITNGLRIEYGSLDSLFVDNDPNALSSDSSETSWGNPTLTEESTPSETSHLNLSRTLSLAMVDYVKAMMSDQSGDLERREIYMRDFYKKVGDDKSNTYRVSLSFPASPYAVR